MKTTESDPGYDREGRRKDVSNGRAQGIAELGLTLFTVIALLDKKQTKKNEGSTLVYTMDLIEADT